MPKEARAEIPYEEIRQNVQRSDYVFLFLTDNVVATEYTRNWVIYEVGVASAFNKRLFVFERSGFPLPYPVPYVTDYMVFDEREVMDVLDIQKLAGKMSEIPPGLLGAGAGALGGGLLFGPLGLVVGIILGGAFGAMATEPLPRVRCPHCRTPFNYWSAQVERFHCPSCRTAMSVGMRDG